MCDDEALGPMAPASFIEGNFMQALRRETQGRVRGKASVYRILSACYYEPEESFLEEDVFGQLERALSDLGTEWAADAKTMETCFRSSSVEDLRIDYTRLFLGPFDIRARPYGSIYLDSGNMVMGDSTMAVLALYREGGFRVAEEFTEMPDHVAVEMEFLYLMNARRGEPDVDVIERDRLERLERMLLEEHLGRWIVPFTESVKRGAQTDFYRKLADLTQCFVLHEVREPAPASVP